MKDWLKKLIKSYNDQLTDLRARNTAATTADEVRAIGAQIEEVMARLTDAQAQLDSLEAEERSAVTPPANAQRVNGAVVGTFGQPAGQPAQRDEHPLESLEYRKAFREYVLNGTPIEVRNGEVITTTGTAPAIPLTIMNEVINTVRMRYGNLYSKVRKTSLRGGVEYPIGALSATFKWIAEGEVSPRQKLNTLAKVTFQYHTAEIRIAQSFLSALLTLEAFEAKIAEVIAIAYLQAMDYGIVNGSGNGQMLGILNDARVTNYITMTAAQMGSWAAWRKNFFAKLPLGYREGEFIFPLSTVDTYLETMADANGNPVFRQATGLVVNDGDQRNPNGYFFGRDISLVEADILPDFDTASANDVIGIYWQPEEYAINENFGFTMRRYFDEETNEWVDKALVVVDGKVLNPSGYYLIKKAT